MKSYQERQPHPKKPPRRTRRILGPWARLGLLMVAIAIAGLAAVGIVIKAIRPYREASLQAAQLAATRRQIAALDVQNSALRRRIANLKTPNGIATEARKIGYLRSGEIPIVIENTDGASSEVSADGAMTTPAPEASPPDRSVFGNTVSRFWHHFMGR